MSSSVNHVGNVVGVSKKAANPISLGTQGGRGSRIERNVFINFEVSVRLNSSSASPGFYNFTDFLVRGFEKGKRLPLLSRFLCVFTQQTDVSCRAGGDATRC